ncbi:hypothetical protein HDU83_004256 [Entophlyctis luteolus]|nr:hypothetical protein HDU83_004256 [Entophlyctis luteolus]
MPQPFELPPTSLPAAPTCPNCDSEFVEAMDDDENEHDDEVGFHLNTSFDSVVADPDSLPFPADASPLAALMSQLMRAQMRSATAAARREGNNSNNNNDDAAPPLSSSADSSATAPPVLISRSFSATVPGSGGMMQFGVSFSSSPPPPGSPFAQTSTIRDRQARTTQTTASNDARRAAADANNAGEASTNEGDDDEDDDEDSSATHGNGQQQRSEQQRRRQTVENLLDMFLRLHAVRMHEDSEGGADSDTPAAPSNPLFRLFGGIGDPRDYVFGQSGIDDIVTQLMEQAAQANAPPHLTEEQIARLPRATVRGADLGEHPECPICQEEFTSDASGETAVKLPCSHNFHPDCIASWMRLNATCPVCRHSVIA